MKIKREKIIKQYLRKQNIFFVSKNPVNKKAEKRIDISIIIPAFNEGYLLPNLLKSLQQQTYKNFEVIVVDNKSTDNTRSVVSCWQEKVTYSLYCLEEEKIGVANARRRGMDEVLRKAENTLSRKHILVSTDADTIPPINWLDEIDRKFKIIKTGVLAGTHGPDPKIDKAIANYFKINNYFGLIPSLIEVIAENNLGLIKVSGPNTAIEIEAYTAGGGIKSEYDNEKMRVKTSETNSLICKIRKNGYPILPMGVRIISSKRRQLMEIIKGKDTYFPKGFDGSQTFSTIREDETVLLKRALAKADRQRWLDYRWKMITTVIDNFVIKPLSRNEIEWVKLKPILAETEVNWLKNNIKNKEAVNLLFDKLINRYCLKYD